MELLGNILALFNILQNYQTFSKKAQHFKYPLEMFEASDFSISSQHLSLSVVFIVIILVGGKWYLTYGIDFYFSNG